MRVAALGTSPSATLPDADAGRALRAHAASTSRCVAADQLTCGMHVHVSVGSRAEGVAAIDAIRALAARAARAVARTRRSGTGATPGTPATAASPGGAGRPPARPRRSATRPGTTRRVAELIATGAALDAAMIYFDARLSAKYPTVEIRVADVVPAGRGLGALVAALAARARRARRRRARRGGARRTVVRAASWRAARFGLSGELRRSWPTARVRPAADVVDRLLDVLGPALAATGDAELVRRRVDRLRRRGTGAELQRADLAQRGALADVVRRRGGAHR